MLPCCGSMNWVEALWPLVASSGAPAANCGPTTASTGVPPGRPVNVGGAEAELEPRVHLVGHGRLHVDRPDLGVVAEEASLEARRGPLRLESVGHVHPGADRELRSERVRHEPAGHRDEGVVEIGAGVYVDRKSTRLNSSHLVISYAVFCLKKKT